MKIKSGKSYTIAGVLLFIALTFTFLGIVFYNYQYNKIEKERKEDLAVTTHFKMLHLSIWINERYEFGKAIVNNEYAVENFYNLVKDKKQGNISESQKQLFNYYLNNYRYKNILLYDDRLNLNYSALPADNFYKENISEIINQRTNKDSVSISRIYKDNNDSIRISIIIPLQSDNKNFGWLLAVINPEDELKPFIELSPSSLNTLSTILIFKEDSTVLYPSASEPAARLDLRESGPLSLLAVKQDQGFVTGKDYRGIETLAYTEKLPGSSFYLMSKIDRHEITDEADVYIKAIVSFIVLIMSLSVLLVVVTWRNNKLKFYKKKLQYEKEKNILLKHNDYLSRYANDIIFLLDDKGIIRQANEKAAAVYGYSINELTGRSAKILRAEETRDEFDNFLNKAQTENGIISETVHRKKSGEKFPVEISVRPFNIEGAGFLQAIVRDVSERKKAEDELKEKEMQYRAIFNHSNDAIFLRDDLKIVDCNERAEILFGYSKKELIGKALLDLSPEYQKGIKTSVSVKEKLDSVLKGNAQLFEWKYLKADGSILDAEVYVSKLELNGKVYTLSIITDITERKKAEKIIKEHSVMLDSVSQAVMATDLCGKITYWNKSSERLYGWKKSEVLGRNITEFTSYADDKINISEVLNTISRGDEWSGEFMGVKKDGSLFPNRVTNTPIYNAQNEVITVVSVSEDLSERKAREKEILLAKEKAEEINKLKSNFLANMSHEVRTPLIGILGYAEMILDEEYDADLKEKVGVIYKSGKKLNETLDTILDISRIEADKVNIVYENINIGALIKESITLYKVLAEEKSLNLQFTPGTNGLLVELDKRLLTKILNNLLSNAIKFTNEGEINVSTSCMNGKIRIEVEDTGIGIPEDKLNIVFEPFRQASEGFNRKFEGAGLGLTITKMLVEMMNGKIYLESEYGRGSKFAVEFPIYAQNKTFESVIKKEDKIVESGDNNFSKLNILLVEDDDINAKIILRFLADDYNAEWVRSGKEALEISAKKKFNVILMDISLRGEFDGLMTAAKIRKIPGYESTSIIAVTAHAMVGDKEKFLNNGCNHYISKPFSRSELLHLLKKNFS